MNSKRGKKVDLKGISEKEIKNWLKTHPDYRKFIKCQVLISLLNDIPMNTVCEVFDTTRESVRRWKDEYRAAGINGLIVSNKKGKSPYLNHAKRTWLTNILSAVPKKHGYDQKKWTGKILKDYVQKTWSIKISVRTAQVWMRSLI
jgi:transposase